MLRCVWVVDAAGHSKCPTALHSPCTSHLAACEHRGCDGLCSGHDERLLMLPHPSTSPPCSLGVLRRQAAVWGAPQGVLAQAPGTPPRHGTRQGGAGGGSDPLLVSSLWRQCCRLLRLYAAVLAMQWSLRWRGLLSTRPLRARHAPGACCPSLAAGAAAAAGLSGVPHCIARNLRAAPPGGLDHGHHEPAARGRGQGGEPERWRAGAAVRVAEGSVAEGGAARLLPFPTSGKRQEVGGAAAHVAGGRGRSAGGRQLGGLMCILAPQRLAQLPFNPSIQCSLCPSPVSCAAGP